jgi:hypothetical protein
MQEHALNSYDVISAIADIRMEKVILAMIIPLPYQTMSRAKSTTAVMRDMQKNGIIAWIK